MSTADWILSWATGVANDWRWLAMAWHLALTTLVLAWVSGRYTSMRRLALFLVTPLMSVALVAWASGNLFNGLAFSILSIVLVHAALRVPRSPIALTSPITSAPGVALVALGWVYPHFVKVEAWTAFAYASPFGLLPCPTLMVVVGMTLMSGGMRVAAWSVPLCAAGLLYGLIGVFFLGVRLDVWLLLGSVLLGTTAGAHTLAGRVQATGDERRRRLAGDDLVRPPHETLTHAITIGAPTEAVWPWLVQMGAGSRAGWYSYDFLDNGRRPSATRIVPELQRVTPGTLFPAIPGATDGFIAFDIDHQRSLVLGLPGAEGTVTVTWAFVLEPHDDATRLIVRVRASQPYRFNRLPGWLSVPLIRLVHFVMQRKQLLEISWRATARIPDAA